MYDPVSKKVIFSKHVVFEVEKAWEWNRSDEEIRQGVLEWEDNADDQSKEDIDGGSPSNHHCYLNMLLHPSFFLF